MSAAVLEVLAREDVELVVLDLGTDDYVTEPQNLRISMRQLRQTLEADPERPRILLTGISVGYRLRAPNDEPAITPRATHDAGPRTTETTH